MLGFIIGGVCGVFCMCLVQVAKKDCIRCNRSSCATICEQCYHELLTENMKIKLQLQSYKMNEVEENKDEGIVENHVPRLD